jgi:flavin-dependent dehydrogenase
MYAKLVAMDGLCWVMQRALRIPVTGEGIYYALRSAELFADAFLKGKPQEYETLWRKDFGGELKRASQMRRRFYGNFWGAPFTERMIEFAKGHRGIRKVLGQLVAGIRDT